jgi:ribosome biogenesis GTPase A
MRFSRQETTYAALEEYLKEAREVARQQQKAEAERQLAEALEKLAGGSFNLVILGQFKRGKSTLINALIGAPLLPMGVIPLTSIATKICYGEIPEKPGTP